jgi:hypothetical protein
MPPANGGPAEGGVGRSLRGNRNMKKYRIHKKATTDSWFFLLFGQKIIKNMFFWRNRFTRYGKF